jgi:hypothetical protein
VEQELRALRRGVAKANLARRNRVGSALLQAYALARRLVLHSEHADLLPHVEEMARAIRPVSGSGTKKKTPAPAPVPQPLPDPSEPMTM